MKSYKMIVAGLAATMLLVTPVVSQAGEALDRVMSSKVLKVATDANWAPQSFLNDKNEMDGFDVDVAKELAKRLGAKVEFARGYAKLLYDRELHDRLLSEVMMADPYADGLTLSNVMAKEQAAQMLAEADNYF